MTKNALTAEQFQKLLIACANLPFIRPNRWATDYVVDVLQTVLDFHMQAPVVDDAITYFREQVQAQHAITTHSQLEALLSAYPDTEEGNKAASQFLWSNNHWPRVGFLRQILALFASINVTDQPALRAWAKQAQFERDFKGKVKGLGVAVFHWLLIRCGADTIKPDVWVIKFTQRVTGKRLSEKALVDVFSKIAPLIGETLETIDVTIWHYEKMGMATKDVPELRVVCWHLLKQEFDGRLKEASQSAVSSVLSDCTWQLVLDPKPLLRYDKAGLTMTPNRSLFGIDHPGATTVVLRQSLWSAGLELEFVIRHATALSQPVFEDLNDRLKCILESGDSVWETSNAPVFEAVLDVEESLMISPDMTIDGSMAWVEEIVGRLVCGMQRLRE